MITRRDLAMFYIGISVAIFGFAALAWWFTGISVFFWPLLTASLALNDYLAARRQAAAVVAAAGTLLADRLRRRATYAQSLLMANRPTDAAIVLDALGADVDAMLDDIDEAHAAAAAENVPDAICHIERFLSPSPARGTT